MIDEKKSTCHPNLNGGDGQRHVGADVLDTNLVFEDTPEGELVDLSSETRKRLCGLDIIAATALALEKCPARTDAVESSARVNSPRPWSLELEHMHAVAGNVSEPSHDLETFSDPLRRSRHGQRAPFTSNKKGARVFTPEQQEFLHAVFAESPYPSRELIQRLAHLLNRPSRKLSTWFNNRRARARRLRQKQKPLVPERGAASETAEPTLQKIDMTQICGEEGVQSSEIVALFDRGAANIGRVPQANVIAAQMHCEMPILQSRNAGTLAVEKVSYDASWRLAKYGEAQPADGSGFTGSVTMGCSPDGRERTGLDGTPIHSGCVQFESFHTVHHSLKQGLQSSFSKASAPTVVTTPDKEGPIRRQ